MSEWEPAVTCICSAFVLLSRITKKGFDMRIFSALLLLVIFSGCTHTSHRLALVSTKSNAIKEVAAQPITAQTCQKNIFFLFPLEGDMDYHDGHVENTIEAALAKAGGSNSLANVKVKEKFFMTGIYNEFCTIVEGTPVSVSSNPTATAL